MGENSARSPKKNPAKTAFGSGKKSRQMAANALRFMLMAWRVIKRILDFLAPITKADPQKGEPWVWHITETFKGLITLSVELVKMLALVNGGAAVALLAYLGNFAAHNSGERPPQLTHALLWFCGGLAATALAVLCAYLTQLRLYVEERRQHQGYAVRVWHHWVLVVGSALTVFAVIAFLIGCFSAAAALARWP